MLRLTAKVPINKENKMNKNENNYQQQNLVYSISLKLHLKYILIITEKVQKYPPVFMLSLLHYGNKSQNNSYSFVMQLL